MDVDRVLDSLNGEDVAAFHLQEILHHFVACAEGDAPNTFGTDTVKWAKRMVDEG